MITKLYIENGDLSKVQIPVYAVSTPVPAFRVVKVAKFVLAMLISNFSNFCFILTVSLSLMHI